MKYTFSSRIAGVQASVIREILKVMNDPEIISFGGGNPASETFPIATLKEISNTLFTTNPEGLLSYGISEGDANLKKELVAFFSRKESITKEYDEVLIASGSQQIMDFLAKVLCNEGDRVICENPSFLGALNAFKSNGVELVACTLENDGINIEEVKQAMQMNPKPKFIYLIPNFQNPTGITMSLEKRKAVYALAKEYQVPILEDNPYGDLRFKNDFIPSIKSLDNEGLVIYAASLSKIIAPGMRVAAMIGDKTLMSKIVVAKQTNDVHTNAWAQAVMAKFLQETDMEQHLQKLQDVYDKKCYFMLSKMEEYFDSSVTWTKPEGGMFIWVTLPDNIDMLTFVQRAIEQKVAVVPGNAFYSDPSMPSHSFRMNFSMPTMEEISNGVKILGDLTKEMHK